MRSLSHPNSPSHSRSHSQPHSCSSMCRNSVSYHLRWCCLHMSPSSRLTRMRCSHPRRDCSCCHCCRCPTSTIHRCRNSATNHSRCGSGLHSSARSSSCCRRYSLSRCPILSLIRSRNRSIHCCPMILPRLSCHRSPRIGNSNIRSSAYCPRR